MRLNSEVTCNAEAVLFHVEYDKIIQRREKKQEDAKEPDSKDGNTSGDCKKENETSDKQN